ncbi:MerR family transcriptional regulator [Acidaminobacter sp. JC074]|uniref:MerR family transcriptional regulator n=1 Tax=Acidaminobacter sp. JC074 TaxID=2530199 RepID=UPI001F0F2DE1|nr:MerR family transcriptional regulator [Acidaminobacter sp. JC074]MCH4890022.1 MerR family transcriptional regulator [Acidaminobacter sp. JC074]
MKTYTIGEIAKALDVSVQAIRLYQRKGLIEPSYVNEDTGYRYFDDQEAAKIWRIKILQSAGFELSEIKALNDLSLDQIGPVLEEKRNKLNEVILQKELALKYLDRQLLGIDAHKERHEITERWIDDRFGIAFGKERRYSLLEHLEDLSQLEGLYGINQEVAYEPSTRFQVIDDELVIDDLFAMQSSRNDQSSIQPGGWYLCTYVVGKDHKNSYKSLMTYVKENGYTLRGDAIRVILINDNLTNHSDYNIHEIQVAILKD